MKKVKKVQIVLVKNFTIWQLFPVSGGTSVFSGGARRATIGFAEA